MINYRIEPAYPFVGGFSFSVYLFVKLDKYNNPNHRIFFSIIKEDELLCQACVDNYPLISSLQIAIKDIVEDFKTTEHHYRTSNINEINEFFKKLVMHQEMVDEIKKDIRKTTLHNSIRRYPSMSEKRRIFSYVSSLLKGPIS